MGKKKNNNFSSKKEQLLLAIKKDDEEIKKYEKLLKIKKKKKSFISDLFSSLNESSDDDDDKMDYEEDNKYIEKDNSFNEEDLSEEAEDISEEVEDISEEEEEIGDEEIETNDEHSSKIEVNQKSLNKIKVNKNIKEEQTDMVQNTKIKQNILQHLNKLCEAQMMKCLDGIEDIWNNFPRGDVRDVFIKESVAYMKFSCIDLAAFIVCLHIRLAKHTNLIAFYMEHLITKLSNFYKISWDDENNFGSISSTCKFVAYITRLETIDCNLILDLMNDIISTFDLNHLKVLVEICSIIGFYIRKNSSDRCDAFVTLVKEKMSNNLNNGGDISELRSYAEAIVNKLTLSKSKSDVVFQSIEKYRKLMKKWCRSTSLSETIALKLSDFQGDNRVRWWLVGSALDPNVAHNKSVGAHATISNKVENFSVEESEWNTIAKSIGLKTEGKQTLFRILMAAKSKERQDDISDVIEQVMRLSTPSGGVIVLSENEVVRAIIRCLCLEEEFCQLYVNVLAALLENHRRFRQIVKCSMWDLLAQPKLVESARLHCGRCVGQLIAMAGLPINILKKFNFIDNSAANTAYMTSVMTELLEENWNDIAQFLSEASTTISVKFVGNLRLFMKKNFEIDNPEKYSRTTFFKISKCMEMMQELRKSNIS